MAGSWKNRVMRIFPRGDVKLAGWKSMNQEGDIGFSREQTTSKGDAIAFAGRKSINEVSTF
jgi:hypothetical protein